MYEVQTNSVVTSSYSFDTNSNRSSQTIGGVTTTGTYDNQDRMLTFGTKTFTYNRNGDLTSVTDSATSTTINYTYDVLGNLKQVVLPAKTVNYLVDVKNRRIAKKNGASFAQFYVYNKDSQLIALTNGSGVFDSRYIYGSKAHVPDYMVRSGVKYKIVTNHLGSPVQVINSTTGVIAQEITYDEFGMILTDTSPGFTPFGFAGCIYDQDTKLCRFGARDYDASIGRWLSKDPIRFDGGDTNLYGYVMQDPVNYIDPEGTWPEWLDKGVCKITGRCDPSDIDSDDWMDTLKDIILDIGEKDKKPDSCSSI